MGPRSIERGEKVWHGMFGFTSGELQWGRAQLSAERGRSCDDGLAYQHASMGPRSIERGEAPGWRKQESNSYASMGPRSIERGEHVTSQAGSPGAWPLQWGRAQLSAESLCAISRMCPLISRFNGAALN